jgi:hypothetical protein
MGTFNPKEIAFALITHYPNWYRGKLRSIKHTDKVRGDLAIEFANKATSLGCQLVVVDGASTKTFVKTLASYPWIKIYKRRVKMRSPSKRQALKIASKIPGVKVIILSEPEKVSLVTDCLPDIVLPILEGKAEIVIPKRNDELFKKSYPLYMYESEIELNYLYNEYLKLHGLLPRDLENVDLCFGPRVIKNDPKILRLFMRRYLFSIGEHQLSGNLYSPEEYSNVQFFPIIQAIKKGLRIESIEVPFSYPVLQKENETIGQLEIFIQKRKNQRLSVLLDLIHFLNYSNQKRGKLK